MKPVSAAVAASMLIAAPVAVQAQTTTGASAKPMSQAEQWCAEAAQRTDRASRRYDKDHCSRDAKNWRTAIWAFSVATVLLFVASIVSADD